MYRIKTDIRQYKCDSVDKVEKLIRNWVIRPNDLIYLPETQRWSPIGEHPLFVRLFELLAEQERAEPETIVTDSPLEAQQANAEPELPAEDPDEVTRIKERPIFEDSEAEEVPEDPKAVDDETLIGRPVAHDTVEEEAQSTPPKEPDNIEKPSRTEEVTVMTAKTLDMIITDDESEAEEATQMTESPLAPEVQTYEEIAQASEPDPSLSLKAPKIGRHDLPEEFFATNEISTPISREDVPPVDDLKALYGTHSVDDAWGELASEEDLRVTEQMDSPLDSVEEADEDLEGEDLEGDSAEGQGLEETSAQEDEEWEEDEEEVDASKIASELLKKHASRISDVYSIPLPFEVGPSPEDEAAGLKRCKLSTAEKDRRFPYPSDKDYSTAYSQEFDLSPPPPKDRTMIFVVGAVLAFLVIILAALM